jgi:hypothetical protein
MMIQKKKKKRPELLVDWLGNSGVTPTPWSIGIGSNVLPFGMLDNIRIIRFINSIYFVYLVVQKQGQN